jgi:hypothetical protein
MANITIKGDLTMGAAIAEGAATVELRVVKEECARLNALNGVRAYGDAVRFEDVQKALAVKYPTEHHGRLYGAIWGFIGYLVLAMDGWYQYFRAWNRGEQNVRR